MNKSIIITRQFALSLFGALIFLCGGVLATAAESDLEIRDGFAPGIGNSVGKVFQTEGGTLIVHSDESIGYRGTSGLPLFMGDTIMTEDDGRMTIHLNDKSSLTLGWNTKIVLNRNVYDPDSKSRSSFFNMVFGKARFMIRKIPGFRRSEVKVKTKTAIVGVRGSDYSIEANDEATEVASFEDTELVVTSLKFPDTSVILGDFEKVRVDLDGLISDVERLIREDADRIRRDFILSRPNSGGGAEIDIEKTVIVPKEELVDPDTVRGIAPDDIRTPEVIKPEKNSDDMETSSGDIDRVVESHREGVTKMPEFRFPNKPQ